MGKSNIHLNDLSGRQVNKILNVVIKNETLFSRKQRSEI